MRRWGSFVYRRRRLVVALSGLVFLTSVVVLFTVGGAFRNSQSFDFESGKAFQLQGDQLPHEDTAGFELVFTAPNLDARQADGRKAFEAQLSLQTQELRRSSFVKAVTTPFSDPTRAASDISADGHEVVAHVQLTSTAADARRNYEAIITTVRTAPLQVQPAGTIPLDHDFDVYLAQDLTRAELVSLPLALLLLVLVFRSVLAALVSLGVGLFAVATGFAGVTLLSKLTDVSTYTSNIVTLIGLGVGIDYSLFIVSRFREELRAGASREEAVAGTMATAGRAIVFSGITVALGLSAMLFFRGTFLVTMGIGGAMVVVASVFFGTTFLPALLGMMGPTINRLAPPGMRPRTEDISGRGAWHRLAMWVMRRPVAVLVPCLLLLLVLGIPFTSIKLANGDITQLPRSSPARLAQERLERDFPVYTLSDFPVVVHFTDGSPPLSQSHVASLFGLTRRLQRIPGVSRVDGVVSAPVNAPAGTPIPTTLAQWQQLYAVPTSALPAAVRPLVETVEHQTVGQDIVLLQVQAPVRFTSDAAHTLVHDLRAADSMPGAEVLVSGNTAFDIDLVDFMVSRMPLAVGFVVLSTMVILFLLLGSVVLPVKAVLMNMLSLSASFGAMVWIFQQGHLGDLLGVTPSPLDPTLPILLFCIIFGLSMDYEVFLLTRMQEAWLRTGDNREAVADGLERSGRLVSGAAAIMVCVFAAFGLAAVVLIKAIGMAMAIAVLVDATIVRALVVPAVMRLLGPGNWWAPAPLVRFHARLGLGEKHDAPGRPDRRDLEVAGGGE